MAVLKCKMCGGDLHLEPNCAIAECEYCSSKQTVPAADSEKKMTLFNRANRLRFACEFDKAAGIYEAIVADFPEEAEAYWGLVLCKYGIEYVDDPATAKKIPTCHRSSFDSVMDDENFEQALENADAPARKVYRAEAKQIEEIRKGIIEVSAKEDPYDIFICYKETDENGDRTLDSVLAQDIYDALTEKGYRTFFARITLEDKLGQEYEPYIFAALNSAKIMLAVGTDYEYYNAVWVKNEWSRFLHLIASGQKKTLIPCYKNIDAYDMPKEFAKLQAQDLGKVGAMQDLLRGVDKIIPKTSYEKNSIPAQPQVGDRISAMLDRGIMALEDGEWEKADSFFEDVLSYDSRNSKAYLGKALAFESCRTIEALLRKRLERYCTDSTVSKTADVRDISREDEIVSRYTLEPILPAWEIRNMLEFDSNYQSSLEFHRTILSQETAWLNENKSLVRSRQFAVGEEKNILENAINHMFQTLQTNINTAEAADTAAIIDLKRRYLQHLENVEERIQPIYKTAIVQLKDDYDKLCRQIQTANTSQDWLRLAKDFDALGGYLDSNEKAKKCSETANRISESSRRSQLATFRKSHMLCQHCGGEFFGFLTKRCSKCGITKDY